MSVRAYGYWLAGIFSSPLLLGGASAIVFGVWQGRVGLIFFGCSILFCGVALCRSIVRIANLKYGKSVPDKEVIVLKKWSQIGKKKKAAGAMKKSTPKKKKQIVWQPSTEPKSSKEFLF